MGALHVWTGKISVFVKIGPRLGKQRTRLRQATKSFATREQNAENFAFNCFRLFSLPCHEEVDRRNLNNSKSTISCQIYPTFLHFVLQDCFEVLHLRFREGEFGVESTLTPLQETIPTIPNSDIKFQAANS